LGIGQWAVRPREEHWQASCQPALDARNECQGWHPAGQSEEAGSVTRCAGWEIPEGGYPGFRCAPPGAKFRRRYAAEEHALSLKISRPLTS